MPNPELLTHCPKISWFQCRFCGRKGEDCLRTCSDCRALTNTTMESIESRIHGTETRDSQWGKIDMIKIAQILCKRCTNWHVRHSLNQRLFTTSVYRDCEQFPDEETIVHPVGCDFVLNERETEGVPSGFLTNLVLQLLCTACTIKGGGIYNRCKDWNKRREQDHRLMIVNGHLHIIDGYCDWHNFSLTPIALNPHMYISTVPPYIHGDKNDLFY